MGRERLELTGQKFGLLTVESFSRVINKRTHWLCKCECGNIKEVSSQCLKSLLVKSCGCLQHRTGKKNHRHKHGKCGTIEYKTWTRIKTRCYCKSNPKYPTYGGIGITMCDRWRDSFENFLADMGKRPENKTSIDRIDVNGNYEKDNCRWSDEREQSRNRRKKSSTGVIGVYLGVRYIKKYYAEIKIEGKKILIGRYSTLDEAAAARKEAEKTYWNDSGLQVF